jgi:hypothetical protein
LVDLPEIEGLSLCIGASADQAARALRATRLASQGRAVTFPPSVLDDHDLADLFSVDAGGPPGSGGSSGGWAYGPSDGGYLGYADGPPYGSSSEGFCSVDFFSSSQDFFSSSQDFYGSSQDYGGSGQSYTKHDPDYKEHASLWRKIAYVL